MPKISNYWQRSVTWLYPGLIAVKLLKVNFVNFLEVTKVSPTVGLIRPFTKCSDVLFASFLNTPNPNYFGLDFHLAIWHLPHFLESHLLHLIVKQDLRNKIRFSLCFKHKLTIYIVGSVSNAEYRVPGYPGNWSFF